MWWHVNSGTCPLYTRQVLGQLKRCHHKRAHLLQLRPRAKAKQAFVSERANIAGGNIRCDHKADHNCKGLTDLVNALSVAM